MYENTFNGKNIFFLTPSGANCRNYLKFLVSNYAYFGHFQNIFSMSSYVKSKDTNFKSSHNMVYHRAFEAKERMKLSKSNL